MVNKGTTSIIIYAMIFFIPILWIALTEIAFLMNYLSIENSYKDIYMWFFPFLVTFPCLYISLKKIIKIKNLKEVLLQALGGIITFFISLGIINIFNLPVTHLALGGDYSLLFFYYPLAFMISHWGVNYYQKSKNKTVTQSERIISRVVYCIIFNFPFLWVAFKETELLYSKAQFLSLHLLLTAPILITCSLFFSIKRVIKIQRFEKTAHQITGTIAVLTPLACLAFFTDVFQIDHLKVDLFVKVIMFYYTTSYLMSYFGIWYYKKRYQSN